MVSDRGAHDAEGFSADEHTQSCLITAAFSPFNPLCHSETQLVLTSKEPSCVCLLPALISGPLIRFTSIKYDCYVDPRLKQSNLLLFYN